jgi:DNA-binding CsgD family transcriptional regulator
MMSELQRVQSAATNGHARLTPTQRDIIRRSSEGASIADIASDLKLQPQRVSDEKYKAIQKLKDYFSRAS